MIIWSYSDTLVRIGPGTAARQICESILKVQGCIIRNILHLRPALMYLVYFHFIYNCILTMAGRRNEKARPATAPSITSRRVRMVHRLASCSVRLDLIIAAVM